MASGTHGLIDEAAVNKIIGVIEEIEVATQEPSILGCIRD
jgi:hypothetical protein